MASGTQIPSIDRLLLSCLLAYVFNGRDRIVVLDNVRVLNVLERSNEYRTIGSAIQKIPVIGCVCKRTKHVDNFRTCMGLCDRRTVHELYSCFIQLGIYFMIRDFCGNYEINFIRSYFLGHSPKNMRMRQCSFLFLYRLHPTSHISEDMIIHNEVHEYLEVLLEYSRCNVMALTG